MSKLDTGLVIRAHKEIFTSLLIALIIIFGGVIASETEKIPLSITFFLALGVLVLLAGAITTYSMLSQAIEGSQQ